MYQLTTPSSLPFIIADSILQIVLTKCQIKFKESEIHVLLSGFLW